MRKIIESISILTILYLSWLTNFSNKSSDKDLLNLVWFRKGVNADLHNYMFLILSNLILALASEGCCFHSKLELKVETVFTLFMIG